MVQEKQSPNSLLRLAEVADRLAVSLGTVRRLVKSGELPAVRIGKNLRVRPQDLDDFIRASIEVNDNARLPDQGNRAKGDQAQRRA